MGWCVLLIFALSGCVAYVGSDSARSNLNVETVSKIIPRKSTKADVLMTLGQPDEVLADGKQFRYVRKYQLAVIFPGSGSKPDPANRYVLSIEFDEQGIVSRRDFTAPYELHDKPVQGVPPLTHPPLFR